MPTLAPTMNPQSQSGFNRGNSFGSEGLEQQQNNQLSQQVYEQEKKTMNNVWNAFLNPDSQPAVSFTRLDSNSPEDKPQVSFAEIYAQMQQDEKNELKVEDSVGTHEAKEAQPNHVASPIVEEKSVTDVEVAETEIEVNNDEVKTESKSAEKKQMGTIEFKSKALGTSKEVLQQSMKIGKVGFKESKDVFNAVSDLWKNFIGFREKKPDPKAKERAEKEAKRKANKQKFIGLLKEGMSLYYAAMKRALIELEVKLGVNVIGVEERNRILGRNRNLSYQGNDSVYAIHQTAYEMVEQKKRQQQAQSAPAAARGKPSAGQIFRDKNLQGERSGGQNMMSAVG